MRSRPSSFIDKARLNDAARRGKLDTWPKTLQSYEVLGVKASPKRIGISINDWPRVWSTLSIHHDANWIRHAQLSICNEQDRNIQLKTHLGATFLIIAGWRLYDFIHQQVDISTRNSLIPEFHNLFFSYHDRIQVVVDDELTDNGFCVFDRSYRKSIFLSSSFFRSPERFVPVFQYWSGQIDIPHIELHSNYRDLASIDKLVAEMATFGIDQSRLYLLDIPTNQNHIPLDLPTIPYSTCDQVLENQNQAFVEDNSDVLGILFGLGHTAFALGHEWFHAIENHNEQYLGIGRGRGQRSVVARRYRARVKEAYKNYFLDCQKSDGETSGRRCTKSKRSDLNWVQFQSLEVLADQWALLNITQSMLTGNMDLKTLLARRIVLRGALFYLVRLEIKERVIRVRKHGINWEENPLFDSYHFAQGALHRRFHPAPISRLEMAIESVAEKLSPTARAIFMEESRIAKHAIKKFWILMRNGVDDIQFDTADGANRKHDSLRLPFLFGDTDFDIEIGVV